MPFIFGYNSLKPTPQQDKKERVIMAHHHQSAVRLNTADARRPQLVIAVPFDQTDSIREALTKLASAQSSGIFIQQVVLDAIRTAAEQTYFWTPEWQEKERAADPAIAEDRVQTFGRIDEMIAFLDEQ